MLLLFISIFSQAQKQIKPEQAKDNIGQTVKLEGNILGVKTFENDDKNPTLVVPSLGVDNPNELVIIAVYPSYKSNGLVLPNESFKGDLAIVTGKIELYKGKPQIVVRSSEQLQITVANSRVIPK